MAQQAPPLPPWSWTDLEQTLYALADTPQQTLVASHFLSGLARQLPEDPRSILLEVMHIVTIMTRVDSGTVGIVPPRPQQLHG